MATPTCTEYTGGVLAQVISVDGSVDIYGPDGYVTEHVDPNGDRTITQFEFSTLKKSADGTLLGVFAPDGNEAVLQPNGRWLALQDDGVEYWFRGDGTPYAMLGTDETVTRFAVDHSYTVTEADGSLAAYNTTGTLTTRTHPNGDVDQYVEGVLDRTMHPDGSFTRMRKDGSINGLHRPECRVGRDRGRRHGLRSAG